MRKLLPMLIVLMAIGFASSPAAGPTKDEITANLLSAFGKPNNSMGYDFYVAVPPNGLDGSSVDFVEVYVASQERTEVDYYSADFKVGTFVLEPFVVKTIKLDPKQSEIRRGEMPERMYRFISKNSPISVYLLTSGNMTSDGFMVIPVIGWGKEYIHCSYWENGEMPLDYFKSGFIVMAAEDRTKITISLKSAKSGTAIASTTEKGRIPGETWKYTLFKGQCYRVATKAETVGGFDISGTTITSDKPIGLVSFHERAVIPQLLPISSRNCLNEMIPPTSTWAKEYYSVQFRRTAGGGDLFRVICKEPDTKWGCSWYDLSSGLNVGNESGTLEQAGDFAEIVNSPTGRPNDKFQSVNGTSKFWADKPIQVFQYSFSSGWDNDARLDPFYITLNPRDGYTNNTTFQIASNLSFYQNFYTLLAVGDSSDNANNRKMLGSLLMIEKNGAYIDTLNLLGKYPQLETNRIPGSNIYWIRMDLNSGAYTVKGETVFGGYVHGLKDNDCYGWPTGWAVSNINEKDFSAPKIEVTPDNSGNFSIRLLENTIDVAGSNPKGYRQVDLGVIETPKLLEQSYNSKIEFVNSPGSVYDHLTAQTNYTFALKTIDEKKDMFAVVSITDRAGNTGLETVAYTAPNMKIGDSTYVDFGNKVRLRTKPVKIVKLENTSNEAFHIYGIYLKNNSQNIADKPFLLTGGGYAKSTTNSLVLGKGKTRNIQVQFNSSKDDIKELDELVVMTSPNNSFSFPVMGKAIIPKIKVDDCNYGKTIVNQTINSLNRVVVTNEGSDTLIVTGITNTNPAEPFTANVAKPAVELPFKLAPGNNKTFQDFGMFSPKMPGKYSTSIIFSHNGDELAGDSVSVWTGEAGSDSGADDVKTVADVTVSPNPISDGKFSVEYSGETFGELSNIEIADETGKTVKAFSNFNANSNKINLQVEGLSNGNYFLKIKFARKEIVEKIAIVK